ncbi:MAG: Flagellar M-ring protein [Candidatus Gallionella acididurans]|uniref:Flagellar M-ring protein n=1 Tax=Candidatus Gallionella acididurans TaxID=1796491 RepID=A0A139BXH9_9PROT|nr:MAG: Flagellar M-ring protein [Candidatus Gallionella acididurans]
MISIGVGVAALIALLSSVWMWGQTPDYRVLYSNLSDRDGGAIIESLQQLNVPYKFAEGGGALMVPSNLVYETRLKLATQGLPKGGTVGFELMENQKFGISQFAEQVNYQRALEGELARSVQSIAAVQVARVHLAIPKPTVFVKEQQKPSASVVLILHQGRLLDSAQVSAVVHLISSSVPEMSAKNVTVVDQNGTLLSANHEGLSDEGLDANQLKYIQQIEQNYVERIESILTPMLGAANVRAQVNADIDFSQIEQTAETYQPNTKDSTLRSQQTVETLNGSSAASGVPGALSNQPPVPATAPIVAAAGSSPNNVSNPTSLHKESTTNYEVDRTIRHTKLPVGSIKRLSVAVVLNNRKVTDAKGQVSFKPLSDAEKAQINNLVSDAVGFDKTRGDSLNVQNIAFNDEKEITPPEVPLWKQPDTIDLAKNLVKYVLIAVVMLIIIFGVIKPALKPLLHPPSGPANGPAAQGEAGAAGAASSAQFANIPTSSGSPQYEQGLQAARQIVQQDPKIVASVIKEWVSGNE